MIAPLNQHSLANNSDSTRVELGAKQNYLDFIQQLQAKSFKGDLNPD